MACQCIDKPETIPKNFLLIKPSKAAKNPRFSKVINQLIQKAEQQQLAIQKLHEEYHHRLNVLEQIIRSNTLRIFGVKEKPGEDTFLVILGIFKDIMNLSIGMSDLESCYRLGQENNCPRPVIIRFSSAETKNLVLRNKKLLKGTMMGISEDLSPERAKLYKEAVNYFGKRNVWIDRGNVKAMLPDKNQLRFRSLNEFDEYLNNNQE